MRLSGTTQVVGGVRVIFLGNMTASFCTRSQTRIRLMLMRYEFRTKKRAAMRIAELQVRPARNTCQIHSAPRWMMYGIFQSSTRSQRKGLVIQLKNRLYFLNVSSMQAAIQGMLSLMFFALRIRSRSTSGF